MLGRYRLLRRLGAGGFGVVWAAFDERLEREVAVKILPRDGQDRSGEREARAAARLNHPGIVALYELGEDETNTYLVSELVPGSTFAELAFERALSDRDVARIGVALADALSHAHARRVIHRDVKPGNVLVLAEPAAGAGFAKLADFGVAHLAGGDPLTRTGDVVGTLAYMAPEQAEGERVTPAADVYSLALTLYEGWAGTNPVRARGPAATARRLGRPLPPLARSRRDLPAPLCRAVDEALDPDPEARLSLDDLRDALAGAEPGLSDEGGLVEAETRERFGIARTSTWRRARTKVLGAPAWEAEPVAVGLRARLGAGAAAGLAALAGVVALGLEPSFSPFAAAACVAFVVALLPRFGWLAAAVAFLSWLAAAGEGLPGTALVLAPALLAVPLLLPRAGVAWSVPALAPLLGVAGLAPLYLVVAALAAPPGPSAAASALRRAGLGVAGFALVVAVELVSGESLLFGAPQAAAEAGAWEGSLRLAAEDALWPLLDGPSLVPVAVWATVPPLLALVVRARSLALDVAGAALWTGALVAGHLALSDITLGSVPLGSAEGLAPAAVLAAVAAVAAAGAGMWPRSSSGGFDGSRMDAA